MQKKAQGNAIVFGAVILVVLLIGGTALMWMGGVIDPGSWFGGEALAIGGAGLTTDVVQCADDEIVTLNIKVEDDGAASETFLGKRVHVKNVVSSQIVGYAGAVTSGYGTVDVDCGGEYELYAAANATASGSAQSPKFTATGNNMFFTLHTNTLSALDLRVKDITNDDWEFLFDNDNATDGLNTTAYYGGNATRVYDTTVAGDIAIGTDGYLDLAIYVKADTARKMLGDAGMKNSDFDNGGTRLDLKTYLCYDVGTDNEWDKDTVRVQVNDGATLPNVLSQIDSDSREYTWLQNAEGCFNIGDIDDTANKYGFFLKAKSGADPDSTNDDVTIYFLTEGFYVSADNSNEVKKGIFTDASTQLSPHFTVTSGEQPYMVLQIS